MGKGNSKPEITIIENLRGDIDSKHEDMELNFKLDAIFFIISGFIVFPVYNVNK